MLKYFRMANGEEKGKYYFIGNYRCLDFLNTEISNGGRAIDLLNDFGDLLSWLAESGALGAQEAKEAQKKWAGTTEDLRTLVRARALRSTMRQAVRRLMKGGAIQPAVLSEVNCLLGQKSGRVEIARAKGGGYEKRFQVQLSQPLQLLVPIVESFADLLCYGDRSLIKKCENPGCVLTFYDTTKNHTRRWCDMSLCGNRAKAAAHYERKRLQRLQDREQPS